MLIQSRKDLSNQKDPAKPKNNNKKINVIGGIQSLGWCNIYNINHSFHYVNRYSPKTTPFILNDSDFAFLKEEESANLFVLDIEIFMDTNIKESLKDIFSEIHPICNFSNIYFLTILKPSLLSHNHLKYEKIIKKIDNFNSELNNLMSEFQFNIIDTSSYIMEINTGENLGENQQQKAPIYTNNDNLLCNYYIKPDIILEILDNELSE